MRRTWQLLEDLGESASSRGNSKCEASEKEVSLLPLCYHRKGSVAEA